jgi:hypothetical protein
MRKMAKVSLSVISLVAVFLFSGCAQRIGAFTITSTKNVQINAKELGERVEGKHVVMFGTPSLEQAIDSAIEKKAGADALIDVVIWIQKGFFRSGFKVVGTPVSTKNFQGSLDENQKLVTSKDVDRIKELAKVLNVEIID